MMAGLEEHFRYLEREDKRHKKRIDALLARYDLSAYRERMRAMLAMAHSSRELENITAHLMDDAEYIHLDRAETIPCASWWGTNMSEFYGAKVLVILQEYQTRTNQLESEAA
jgi:hypothetical protein